MKLDLFGWFPKDNEEVLGKLIKENGVKSVIEIGCFLGKSTAFFVSQGCDVKSIDTFEGADDLNCTAEVQKRLPILYEQFLFNIKELGIADKVEVLKGSSEFWNKEYPVLEADLIFIDGSHIYEDVKKDIQMWLPRAQKILCGDDYNLEHKGVKDAVDELLPFANKNNRVWYLSK